MRTLRVPHRSEIEVEGVDVRLGETVANVTAVLRSRWTLRHVTKLGLFARCIGGRAAVRNRGYFELGRKSRLLCDFSYVDFDIDEGGRLVIGENATINYGTEFVVKGDVQLGNNVSMGPRCIVTDSPTPPGFPRRDDPQGSIVIGNDVWLASRVTVLAGARIGAGCVVSAGAVVDSEIPPGMLVGGVPARVLGPVDQTPQDPETASASAPQPTQPAEPEYEPEPGETEPATVPDATGLLISDFTIDPLARSFENVTGPLTLSADVGPFDAVIPALLDPPESGRDFVVVWTRPERAVPSLGRLINGDQVEADEITADVAKFANVLLNGVEAFTSAIVPLWTLAPWDRGLGAADLRAGGARWGLQVANAALLAHTNNASNVFVVDPNPWFLAAGAHSHDDRLWLLGKVPYSNRVFEVAAQEIAEIVRAGKGGARKLIVVDLDNTMWGGVVGDEGWEQLRLGGHDAVGEAHVAFQHVLKRLKRRGVLLAIASKNDEAVALEAVDQHPEMVLGRDDFVGWRIDWNDKARNIADLVDSLNLGLQSVVFLDDSPHERTRVREALPEVLVPELSDDPRTYPRLLLELRCFDVAATTSEDRDRTSMYRGEAQRQSMRDDVSSLDDWVRDLDVKVTVSRLSPANINRTAQLLNKTNQMNLATRRLSQEELDGWDATVGNSTWTINVADRIGDAGLCGIFSLSLKDNEAHLVDFVLSCRVMARRVEDAMLSTAGRLAADQGAQSLVAHYAPTAKNKPCRQFFESSEMAEPESDLFVLDLSNPPSDVEVVTVEFGDNAASDDQ